VWKTAWRRESGDKDDDRWKELLDRKESKREKKPLIERPQQPTPLQLGEMLKRRFVKERVLECCVCAEFSVAENSYENKELPKCSDCRRHVCQQIGKCYENCHYCGAVLQGNLFRPFCAQLNSPLSLLYFLLPRIPDGEIFLSMEGGSRRLFLFS